MLTTSRGFAVFGGLFSIFECQIEKVYFFNISPLFYKNFQLRLRDDALNSFWAGAFTSIMISINGKNA